ncbi:cilia- and flagella-associated protein 184 [Strix uralensis]|uniref:cilia- and flagella-associated protein 184 n=1 Tax=Strix uralensis TaxID=36305 RepID=UPI003DA6F7E8
MEAAAGLGRPEGPAELSPGAPGESPGPEAQVGPGEPAEPRAEVPAGPPPEEPPGLSEPEKLGPEAMEPPGPSEPEVAAGPPGPSNSGPAVAAPAAGGAGEEEASGRDGAAGEAPPAARAEEAPGPPAPAAPGGAERRSGEEERRERAALLELHRGLAGEGERLRQASARLQLRLGERLRLRQGERRLPAGLGAAGPQLYGQRLRELRGLWQLREREAAACQERVAARQRGGQERQARAQAEWAAFQRRTKAVAAFSPGRRRDGGAAAAAARIQAQERDKEQRVREARVEHIKLKHEIQNLETVLKAQGELVESQRFVDFEHVRKENQKHNKKIDDLSDEIQKLKKKVSNTVHIFSQFREKLQFVEAENQGRKAELMDIETVLSQERDVLTKTKQARDRLRRNNLKLQQKCGLLGNEILLRDFEEKVDTAELLSQQLETLKHHHAGLILTCRGIQKKIREANSSFLAEND